MWWKCIMISFALPRRTTCNSWLVYWRSKDCLLTKARRKDVQKSLNIHLFVLLWSMNNLLNFALCVSAQVRKKVCSGYRLPPPPGCSRLIYTMMMDCWWVTVVFPWLMGTCTVTATYILAILVRLSFFPLRDPLTRVQPLFGNQENTIYMAPWNFFLHEMKSLSVSSGYALHLTFRDSFRKIHETFYF